MTFVSYAQNFEDVLLRRVLADIPEGRYVDVGAGHPVWHSVTKAFYDDGWSGLNIEPLPEMAQELRRRRPRDTTVQAAVTASPVETVELVVVETWDELSTISPDRIADLAHDARQVRRVSVPTARLDTLMVDDAPIHFLKIDVEGAELDVLATIDLSTSRPWVLLCEVISGGHDNPRVLIRDHLTGSGYTFAYFDGLNDFYVADEHAATLLPRFRVPVNVTDDFLVASTTDRVVTELIGARLGVASPVHADELLQRVDGVVQDRVRFESEARTAQEAVEALSRTIAELRAQTQDASDGESLADSHLIDELETARLALDASRSDLDASQTAASELRADLETERAARVLDVAAAEGLVQTVQALQQSVFERERLIAWYGAELANHRLRLGTSAAELIAAKAATASAETRGAQLEAAVGEQERARVELGRHTSALQGRIDDILTSTSWRVSLPIRVVRSPGRYLRKLIHGA